MRTFKALTRKRRHKRQVILHIIGFTALFITAAYVWLDSTVIAIDAVIEAIGTVASG